MNSPATRPESPLTAADLIRDEPLDKIAGGKAIPDSLDLLNHRSTARRVAQLASTAEDQLNIAVFGPWGSGKSSFFGLLEEELGRLAKPPTPIRFDAWRNAGPGFRENFLAELSRKLGDPGMDQRLFSVTRSVKLPFVSGGPAWRRPLFLTALIVGALIVVVGLPILHTFLTGPADADEFWARFWPNWIGWVGVGASSSVIVVVLTTVANLTRVDVEEARPSYVSQFRSLFHKLMDGRPGERFVILIDELDRCAAEDVMTTLDGLRTFLGHERCVFVVAFDRAAIAAAIRDHSKNEVPLREGAAYYATAGEYLDKIFQFQVSLPPQPYHGPRRFALSLVERKAGVWGELRARSPHLLPRVVQLLSPIHLRSPRRTKVLLNDFAINMRLYESMGFDWIDRAEEIAAWTVLQTEFPGLAHAMEQDTRTLARIMREIQNSDSSASPSEAAEEVAAEAPGPAPELDQLDTDVVVGRTDDNAKLADEISQELRDDLRAYLKRLIENKVILPRADLILMHGGGDLLKFDDPSVYNLLQDVAGVSRAEALSVLNAAEAKDQVQAITYLLEQLETELPSDERLAVLVLLGALADKLPLATIQPFTSPLRHLWEGLDSARVRIANFPNSASGFLRSFAGLTEDAVEAALGGLPEDEMVSGPIVERLVEDSTDSQLAAYGDVLLARAAIYAPIAPHEFADLLARIDRAGVADLHRSVDAIAAAFTVEAPVPTAPEAPTALARAEALEVDGRAVAAFEEDLELAQSSFSLLAQGPLEEDGVVRSALIEVLLAVRATAEWPLVVLDQMMDREDISRGRKNHDLLRAIINAPEHAAARWIGRIVEDEPVQAAVLQGALDAVIRRGARADQPQAQKNAEDNTKRLLALQVVDGDLDMGRMLEACSDLLAVTDWNADRIETAFGLLGGLSSMPDGVADRLETMQSDLMLVALDYVDASGVPSLLRAVEQLPAGARARLSEELTVASGDLRASVLVRAQAGLNLDRPALVPALIVAARFPSDPELVNWWLATGPSPEELQALRDRLGLLSLDEPGLAKWATAVDEVDRSAMWRLLFDEGSYSLAASAAGAELPVETVDHELAVFTSATSAQSREDALAALLYLPAGSRVFKRAVLQTVPALATAGTQQDLAFAVTLLERGPAFSTAERARVRALMDSFVSRHPRFIARARLNRLADMSLLSRRGLDAIAGLFARR